MATNMSDIPNGHAFEAVAGSRSERAGFRDVLVGVDGTRSGRDAIALGFALCDPDGRLTLAHVSAGNAGLNLNFDPAEAKAEALRLLDGERIATGVAAELASVASLTVGSGLHRLAERRAADLLVVGSCKRGRIGRVFVGDDTRASLNGASSAVAVAPHGYAEHATAIKTIGVGYNDSSEAVAALALARSLAARHGAEVRVLTVVKLPIADISYWEVMAAGSERAIEALKETATTQLRPLGDIEGRVAVGVPGEELATFGDELDLLVVGSRSYGPVRRLFLGSTSQHLAHSARCPLLVLPRRAVTAHGENPEVGEPAVSSAA